VRVTTVRKSMRLDPSMLGFACFPLIFSLHQLVESVVWYSLAHPFAGDQAFRYVYTVIAFIVWPVLTPLAAALFETNAERKRMFVGMGVCGIGLAIYLSVKLAGADGINVSVVRHSLAYDPLFERPPLVVDYAYLVLSIVPLGMLNNRALNVFGVLLSVSLVYAIIEKTAAWYSVWCFSAAVFSAVIFLGVRQSEQAAAVDRRAIGDARKPGV
jgi:hypothetical protein